MRPASAGRLIQLLGQKLPGSFPRYGCVAESSLGASQRLMGQNLPGSVPSLLAQAPTPSRFACSSLERPRPSEPSQRQPVFAPLT